MGALLAGCGRANDGVETVEVQRDDLQVWTSYDGTLDSRTVHNITTRMGGQLTIVELIPESTAVTQGEVLVRFDSAAHEKQMLQTQKEFDLARSDLEGLEKAKLPLELRDLEARLLDAQRELMSEQSFLEDSQDLVKEGLIASMEAQQQEKKVVALQQQVDNLQEQLRLTRDYLHPAQLDRARTLLNAASKDYDLVRDLLANCTVTAPVSGIVVYRPIPVGGEYRTVRAGDVIYRSQPFMAIPDMDNLVVHIDVPESELSRVSMGQAVVIQPKAFPSLKLKGVVESVGSMAQSRMDRPSWQKYFHIVINLDDRDPALRTGMSVTCRILNHEEKQALVIPRLAVRWDGDAPYCEVLSGSRREKRPVELGKADEQRFAIHGGLKEGERVVVE